MGAELPVGHHVQMVVDVVIPTDKEPFLYLVDLVELLNSELHRHGLQESVWVVRPPELRA